MNLRDLDLNLLVILNQLLIDRSVSLAADRLGVTQPAVSNALKRLRGLLKDELFVRTSRGMDPTPYAMHLAEPVAYALNALQNALSKRDAFNPQTSQRAFNLSMTDIGDMYFMPQLMATLAERDLQVRMSTVRPYSADLKQAMEDGSIDVAIGLLPDLKSGFFQRRLFRQRYVCLFRRDHPIGKAPLTIEQFSGLGHVGVLASNTGHEAIDGLLQRAGVKRDVRLVVPHFIAVGHILQSTDLIATVPERFAERCYEPFGLNSCPVPFQLPEIAINLFWHTKYNHDPANIWLRQLIVELFADSSTLEKVRVADSSKKAALTRR